MIRATRVRASEKESMGTKAPGCLCDEIDPSDRPCLVCEAEQWMTAPLTPAEQAAVDAAEREPGEPWE